jgi:predicted GIY-YIG superfamily endonuclease
MTNGKVYIGQTKNTLNQRVAGHKYSAANQKSQSYFHKAIRQYGFESFQWESICECTSKEELDIKEIEYISLFESHASSGKGYTKA